MAVVSTAKFRSSLKPIVILMKMLGLPLDLGSSSAGLLFVLIAFSFIILVINITSHGYLLWKYAHDKIFFKRNDFGAFHLVKCVINFLLVSGVPVIFVVHLLTGRWSTVWNFLIRIQNVMQLNKQFYRWIFNVCIIMIIVLLAVRKLKQLTPMCLKCFKMFSDRIGMHSLSNTFGLGTTV